MSEFPVDLKYQDSHEWVRVNDDGTVTVGISDYAQQALGDLVFVELPELGSELDAGTSCAVVESVKSASDIYCPISGEVIAVNTALEDTPELINSSPFDEGWIMTLRPDEPAQIEGLLNVEQYQAMTDE